VAAEAGAGRRPLRRRHRQGGRPEEGRGGAPWGMLGRGLQRARAREEAAQSGQAPRRFWRKPSARVKRAMRASSGDRPDCGVGGIAVSPESSSRSSSVHAGWARMRPECPPRAKQALHPRRGRNAQVPNPSSLLSSMSTNIISFPKLSKPFPEQI
jgi:hypothetical protein